MPTLRHIHMGVVSGSNYTCFACKDSTVSQAPENNEKNEEAFDG